MDPTPETPKPAQGCYSHKPDCKCRPCAARRRKEEAIARATGEGRYDFDALAPDQAKRMKREIALNADLPPIIATRRSQRDRVLQWLHYRHTEPTLTNKEIAEKLGLQYSTLKSLLHRASQQGWLKFEEPVSRLEHEVVPRVIDNLVHFLNEKDKTVTIEAAKGTIFKQYAQAQGISEAPQTVLALKIETAETPTVKAISGRIVGKPKLLAIPEDDSAVG